MKKIWIGIAALLLTLGVATSLQYFSLPLFSKTETTPVKEIKETAPKEVFLYGINVTGLNIVEGTVSKNQTLGSILAPFNVPYQIIDELARRSKAVFDVRGISINKKFTILTPEDSTKAQFFIYEPNPAEFVVFNLDSLNIYKAEKPAEIRSREVGGVIQTSLYVDMVKQDVSPDMIDQFADLYGWSVDFQRLQKGDKFKVVYEEKIIDGNVISVSDIKLAYFEHMGVPYLSLIHI